MDATDPAATEAPPRGRPRDAAADERILASTFRQLIESGYAGLSIEAVAADAGVARTTIYRRYPSKRELVVAALRSEVPFEGPPADLPARDALERFVHLVIGVLIESGAFRVMGSLLAEEQREPELMAVFRERLLLPRRAIVEAMLRRGIERGEIRPDIDPLVVTESIAGAVFAHHLILGLRADEAWIRSLVEHTWTAIRADQGRG